MTGAAGFMGSHLARRLLDLGHKVVGVDNLSGGYADWLPRHDQFTFAELDLNNYGAIYDLYSIHKPACTYHFAAYAAEGLSPFIRRFNYQNNLLASASVINACIEHDSKLVFTSSMAVYGEQTPPFTEDLVRSPVDPYGIAKAATEMDIEVAGIQHGLEWSIVRPHNVVGIRQNIWDRYRNVLGIFIRRVLSGQPMLVYGDGHQRRAFSDIQFYLDPFVRLAHEGTGEIFNLGADRDVTILELAEMVKDASKKQGISAQIEFVESRHEVTQAYSSHAKAQSLLGFKDATDLPQVIDQVFEWASSEPARSVLSMEYEVSRGIYGFWK